MTQSGSSVFCQSACSESKRRASTSIIESDILAISGRWAVGDQHLAMLHAANSADVMFGAVFLVRRIWQLAPLLPSVGGAAYAPLSG